MIDAAVLGSPISHSLSPLIHTSAYKLLGIEGKYVAHEVKSGELKEFLANHMGATGFSLTMPLKEEVIACADQVDPLAAKIASANTLLNKNGKWIAQSTDVTGFRAALQSYGVARPQNVLILGSGGTARAVAAAVDSKETAISVLHRNPDRENAMRGSVSESPIRFLPWGDCRELYETALVVNTTPAGAADSLALSLSDLPQGILFDVLYKPWPTELAQAWNEKVIPGIELLIYQAIDQIALMTGADFDHEELAEQLRVLVK